MTRNEQTNPKVNIMTTRLILCTIVATLLAFGGVAVTAAEAAPACCAAEGGKAAACCTAAPGERAEKPACCSDKGNAEAAASVAVKRPRELMQDAMALLSNHDAITRTVEEIPGGVRTVTTSGDPEVVALLQRHPREMAAFYETGNSVRRHDPLFVELSRVADKINMEFRNVENGVEVVSTSTDENVVKLIRAHAQKVSDFVKRGMAAMHENTPLPKDYTRPGDVK